VFGGVVHATTLTAAIPMLWLTRFPLAGFGVNRVDLEQVPGLSVGVPGVGDLPIKLRGCVLIDALAIGTPASGGQATSAILSTCLTPR